MDDYPVFELKFTAGDTVRFRVAVEDPDPDSPDPTNPVMIPRDLTGYSAASQIRKTAKALEVMATFTIGELGPDGFIPLLLTSQASQPLGLMGKGVWDLQLTDPNGEVDTILGGPVLPKPDVTRV